LNARGTSVDESVKSHFPSHAYRLYADGCVVSYLQWRNGSGWYLWQRGSNWRLVASEPEPARALDTAAGVLLGPPERGPDRGEAHYELHVCGLAPDVVPIAFPETITVRTGDVSVLAGEFDDAALSRVTRRITILGGELLALFEERAS
jgi:hypothetical protein